MGGRRNETHTRRRVAHTRYDFINLITGKLSAFARFGALSHFDLKLIRADQIFTRDSEPRGGNLLNRARTGITVRIGNVSSGIFAALSGIASAANAVHGDGKRFMR